MSGARVNDHDVEEEQIFALARGFNALLEITQKLTYQERQLRNRLQLAQDEVRNFNFFENFEPHSLPFPFSLCCKYDERFLISSRSGAVYGSGDGYNMYYLTCSLPISAHFLVICRQFPGWRLTF